MQTRPVYRALNVTLSFMGVERKLFFVVVVTSLVMWHLLEAFFSSLAMAGALTFMARQATQIDPKILQLVINSGKFAPRYDPAKFEDRVAEEGTDA